MVNPLLLITWPQCKIMMSSWLIPAHTSRFQYNAKIFNRFHFIDAEEIKRELHGIKCSFFLLCHKWFSIAWNSSQEKTMLINAHCLRATHIYRTKSSLHISVEQTGGKIEIVFVPLISFYSFSPFNTDLRMCLYIYLFFRACARKFFVFNA